jgi:hypothetical protein
VKAIGTTSLDVDQEASMLEEPWDQGVIHWYLAVDSRLEA